MGKDLKKTVRSCLTVDLRSCEMREAFSFDCSVRSCEYFETARASCSLERRRARACPMSASMSAAVFLRSLSSCSFHSRLPRSSFRGEEGVDACAEDEDDEDEDDDDESSSFSASVLSSPSRSCCLERSMTSGNLGSIVAAVATPTIDQTTLSESETVADEG